MGRERHELYRRARDSADAAWERVPCVAQRANQKAYAPFGVAHFVADADAVWAVRADDGRLMRCRNSARRSRPSSRKIWAVGYGERCLI